jgi:hypothetical protein
MVAHGPRGAICCPRVTVPGRCAPEKTGLAGGGCHRIGCQLGAGHGAGAPPAACDSPRSNARTSDSRNLRCPPGVRMLLIRPEAAHRVTVFGSTRKSAATSPGVRRRSLLPSTDLPLPSPFRSMSSVSRKHPFTSLFSPKMSRWCPLSASVSAERAGSRAQQRRLAHRYRRLYTGSGGMCRPVPHVSRNVQYTITECGRRY